MKFLHDFFFEKSPMNLIWEFLLNYIQKFVQKFYLGTLPQISCWEFLWGLRVQEIFREFDSNPWIPNFCKNSARKSRNSHEKYCRNLIREFFQKFHTGISPETPNEKFSQILSKKFSEWVPGWLSEETSGRLPKRIAKWLPEELQKDFQKKLLEDSGKGFWEGTWIFGWKS